ncbi:beta-ketoacyl synthase N-terminal-like domain-containing protein [Streptomyces sp. NPDC051243]|uniref:beta-ketoacyl synthase N-terminal-like domain-containing protein n=1 Tax=Streptomyces sp. NPDC051243 TaxID=3365646 RepID=UPI003790BB3A
MTDSHPEHAVAIVGLAGRFPGGGDVTAYWQRLLSGETAVRRTESAAPASPAGTRRVPVAGAIDDADLFDAEYFGIAPAEAAAMDPQHRLFLEEALHALEDAGWADTPDVRVGVFCGSGENRYAALADPDDPVARTYVEQWGNPASLPLRVSYHLGLRGPSVYVSTLCSTSLTAVHLARRSLLAGDCDLALAGAVSVQLPHEHGYDWRDGAVTSPTGVCRPFDASADGTVPGSGVGVVVLRRLDDALHDGDTVHAVIRGSALNNDGADRLSFAAPSVTGQRDVILAAADDAGIDLGTVGFVEAHGTGTALGDPVELAALREARAAHKASGPLAVGAVKSSIGHLDTAAGIAGLVKATLAVREGVLPATAHHTELSPQIDLTDSGIRVNTETRPWPDSGQPRRAGVTALGMGGTNAHVIVEEPPPAPASTPDGEPWIIPLSSHTSEAFRHLSGALARALERQPELPVADVAATLQSGRRKHPWRRAWVAARTADLSTALAADPQPRTLRERVVTVRPDHVPGALTAELDTRLPQLAEALGRAAAADEAGRRLWRLHGGLTALMDVGARPDALVGVGAGEYVACAVAGALPADIALRAALLHTEAVGLAEAGQDLSRCESLLEEIDRLLESAAHRALTIEVRSAQQGTVLPVGHEGAARHLAEMSRDAVMDPRAAQAPEGGLDLAEGLVSWTAWLGLLARTWERGGDLDWTRLRTGGAGRRIPLPAYPFARQRHWWPNVPGPAAREEAAADAPAPAAQEDVSVVLTAIWRDVLGVDGIQEDDDFFALGGHSIIAVQVLARLRETYGVRISLGDLLAGESFRDMATLVEKELAAMHLYRQLSDDRAADGETTWEPVEL